MSESTFDRLSRARLPSNGTTGARGRWLWAGLLVLAAGAMGLGVGLARRHVAAWFAPPPATGAPAAAAGFHQLPDMLVNLRPGASVGMMKIGLTVRVPGGRLAELAALEPVLIDGVQGYLRALDEHDLAGEEALFRLRQGLLRRVRLLAGAVPVEDVLIRTLILQ